MTRSLRPLLLAASLTLSLVAWGQGVQSKYPVPNDNNGVKSKYPPPNDHNGVEAQPATGKDVMPNEGRSSYQHAQQPSNAVKGAAHPSITRGEDWVREWDTQNER